MATIVDYAQLANDTFSERPLGAVDALCLSWLAYARYPDDLGFDNRAGMRLADIVSLGLVPSLAAQMHDARISRELFEVMGSSARFGNVRACLHKSESDEVRTMQFSATTFVLPERAGVVVAYRGTDDSVLGWKENFLLCGAEAVAAQDRAAEYLQQVAGELGGALWACGHSKGGCLAEYAGSFANDEVRARLAGCLSFDGPGLNPELEARQDRWVDLPRTKFVPQESLVGMIFESRQEELTCISSTATGVGQHDPLTWEIVGNDFVRVHGLSYDAWRLARRLNDWLASMAPDARDRFAVMLGRMVDATAETSFSGLLRRWSYNRGAMRDVLDAVSAEDRASFTQALDDLATTLLLGSPEEHGVNPDDSNAGRTAAAARQLDDATAHARDRLDRLNRLAGLGS